MNTMDKGVISAIFDDPILQKRFKNAKIRIVEDEEMPFLEDGTHVEMICDLLGVGNRLNSGQMDEVELNFYKVEMIKQMKAMELLDDKVRHLFKFCKMISDDFHDDISAFYYKLNDVGKESFIESIEENPRSFSLRQAPMYGNMDLDKFDALATEFDIKPVDAYIYKFGRKIKLMSKVVVGDKYIYKLKHHPKGKFSSRSTSYINSKDQPAKSATTKQNKAIYPTTPLKFGRMLPLTILIAGTNSVRSYY